MENNDDGISDLDIEFSPELKEAITAYNEFMQKYDIPAELSAEALMGARMETSFGGGAACCDNDECSDEDCTCDEEDEHEEGGACCDHDGCEESETESPTALFMQRLITAASSKKELTDEDVLYIAKVASTVDEAAYNDFVRISSMINEDMKKEQEENPTLNPEKDIPSPFI